MEEKNELSDIILDNKNNSGSSKIKKILILSIILLLIFIFAILGMKFFNKPEVKKNNFNIVLPPEPKTKNKPKADELFKQVPIIEENSSVSKDNFNAMVEKLKNKEQTKKEGATNDQKNTQQVVSNKKPKPKPKLKAKAKNVKTALAKAKKSIKRFKKTTLSGSTYIQVGVTFKTKPNKKFLQKVVKAGYSYKLYTLRISGKNATKILIGPYKNTKDAKLNLSKIKREINKAAFIYVIK